MLNDIKQQTLEFEQSVKSKFDLFDKEKPPPDGFTRLRTAAKEFDEHIDSAEDNFSLLYTIANKHQVSTLGILEHLRLFKYEKKRLKRYLRERRIMQAYRSALRSNNWSPNTIYNYR